MTRTSRILLEDILESIELIEEYTTDLDRQGFVENQLVQDGVVRRLEIIGEAVKGLSSNCGKATRRFHGGTLRVRVTS